MVRNIDRNLNLYPWLQFSSSSFAWLPVFFLFFSQFVTLSEVIQLGAFYYFCVCVFEVPSGYFSDRVGRRITLFIASYAFIASNMAFIFADGFYLLLLGQLLLALGMAMLSGTDTAFLYDSLLSVNREHDYATCEARGQAYSMTALALFSLAGGGLGLLDLRLPYVLALLGAIWMLWLVWQSVEPEEHRTSPSVRGSFLKTISRCVAHLKDQTLAWLFFVMVLMYSLEHVVYEFYQPYIKLLDINWFALDSSPLVSGVVISVSMMGGTLGAMISVRLGNLLGLKLLLIGAFIVQLFILASLSIVLSSMALSMVVLRNFPMASIYAPVNAAIAPRIGSELRASYLSIQSLSARLVFSGLLLVLSSMVSDISIADWESLSLILRSAFIFGVVGTIIAAIISPVTTNSEP